MANQENTKGIEICKKYNIDAKRFEQLSKDILAYYSLPVDEILKSKILFSADKDQTNELKSQVRSEINASQTTLETLKKKGLINETLLNALNADIASNLGYKVISPLIQVDNRPAETKKLMNKKSSEKSKLLNELKSLESKFYVMDVSHKEFGTLKNIIADKKARVSILQSEYDLLKIQK